MRNHTCRRGLSFLMAVCMALSMTNSFVYAQDREDLADVAQQSVTEEAETSKDLPPAAVDNLDTPPKTEEAKDPPTPNSSHPADSEEPDVSEPPVCNCPVTDRGEVTHSADCPLYIDPGEPAQEKKCTCTALCTEDAVDETCPVCAEHWESCAFTEERPEVKCTCTALCAEGAVDETCPVCAEHWQSCAFTEEQPEVKCTCTALCAEGAVDETCPVCAEHWENCAFAALEPSKAAKAAAELIAALPAAEAVQAEFEAYYTAEEPDTAAIAARVEELRAAILAARAACDGLSEEEKAAFDPTALEKLVALESWLAAIPAPMALDGTEIELTEEVASLEPGKTYVINDNEQWQNFSNLVVKDADKGETDVDIGVGYGATVKLNAHISGGSIGGTSHLGGKIFFGGTFDGQGHTVTLTIYDHSVAGLFTYVGGGAAIKNVRVTGTIKDANNGGGIVGEGVFTNSGVNTISGCVNEANITCGGSYVGGIAGDAKYIKIENCVNTGDITGGYHVGGIAGVATLHLSGCYSSGKVKGTEFVGGIAGTVRNSLAMDLGNSGLYALGETVTGDRNVGRVVGTFETSNTLKNMYARADLRMGAAGKEDFISGGTGVSNTGIHGQSIKVDGKSNVQTALSLGSNWSYPDGEKFDYGCSLPLPSGMLGIDYPTLQGSPVDVPTVYDKLTLVPSTVTMAVGSDVTIKALYGNNELAVSGSGWSIKSGTQDIIQLKSPYIDECLIHAVKAGSDTLVATGDKDGTMGQTAECTVTVVNAPTGVTLNQTALELKAGDTGTLKATVAGTTYQNVIWTSSDEGVAAVDEKGNVTARVGGTATITAASALDNTKKASCEVTVTPRVSSVALNNNALSIEKNRFGTLSVFIIPTGAAYQSITWSSSNTNIVTVEQNNRNAEIGDLTAGSTTGTATITATVATEDGTFTDTCLVTVTEACTCKPMSPAIGGQISSDVNLTIPAEAESVTYQLAGIKSGFNGECLVHTGERSVSYRYEIRNDDTYHPNTAGGRLEDDLLTVTQAGTVSVDVTATASPSGKETSRRFDFNVTKATPTEATPEIAIDYEAEALTGFAAGGSYTVDGSTVTLDGTTLAIAEGYFGKTLSIVKKGESGNADSDPQSLSVSARPAAPTDLSGGEGTITGVDDTMEYQLSGASGWTPVPAGATTLTGLGAGAYLVRVKAVANASFASLPSEAVAVEAVPDMTITVALDGVTQGGTSLEDAVGRAGAEAGAVKALTMVSGELTTADWTWFQGKFSALTDFTVKDGVAAADIPNGSWDTTVFPKTIERVNAAGVKTVGGRAFTTCQSLVSASFPDATNISLSAFSGCTALESVAFPKATSIGSDAFYNCKALASAEFPEAETIGNYAFQSCSALASASFQKAKTIEMYAFEGCKALTSVEFPAVETIGKCAFQYCSALTSVKFPTAKTIGEKAFYSCGKLATAEFPVATSVGDSTFEECYMLESASIPKATAIGSQAFYNCEALAAADFPKATTLGTSAFYRCYALTSARFPLLTKIPDRAFYICKILDTVDFPKATTIGSYAFYSCDALKSVSFPEAATIGDSAFAGCSVLVGASFPKATSIGDSAFISCTSLKTPTFGEVTAIGSSAFKNCRVLTAANFPLMETVNADTFSGCEMLSTIDFAAAASIGQDAFKGCKALQEVSFPKVTTIRTRAFSGCSRLVSACFPLAATIGDSAFSDCTQLASASFPRAATIEYSAFYRCVSLKALTLGATHPAVANANAFEQCPAGRWLALVDENGAALTGDALAAAQTAYDGVTANGNAAGDGLWYGWTVKAPTTYTVTFDGDGATTPADPSSKTVVSPATTVDSLPTAPKKDGFVFGGWWTEKNGGGTQFTASTAVAGDLTVYAKWTALTPITIGETPQTATYNGEGWIFTVKPTPAGVDGFTVSYTKGGVTVSIPKDAGSYDVTVTRAADGTYAAFEKTITGGLVISPAVPTLAWPAKSQTIAVGGQITPPGVTLAGGETYSAETHGEIAYAYKPKTATVASFFRGLFSDGYTQGLPEAAGEYLVSAALAAKGNYAQAATAEDLALTIEEASEDKITVTMDGTSASGAGLEDAVTNSGKTAATVKTLTVTAGELTEADWAWFQGKFSALTDFTIREGVTAADIPNGSRDTPVFPKYIQRVNAAGVKAVGGRAFTTCQYLVSANFPDATALGERAFYYCPRLKSASFPKVTKVGSYAFGECTALTAVEFTTATIIDVGAFAECDALAAPSFPAVKYIGASAFRGCDALATPSFPVAISIGESAFSNCYKLTGPVFGEVKYIYASAFSGCARLTSASFPQVDTISGSAFAGCKKLETISFPAAMSIGGNAFSGCVALTSASAPAAKSIGMDAFSGCTALMNVSFPEVLTISGSAFKNCSALASASFPKATSINANAFNDCAALQTLALGISAPSATATTFEGCPDGRKLELVGADGAALEGDDLARARMNYKRASDGDTTDNYWYGWKIDSSIPATDAITIKVNGGEAVGGDDLAGAISACGVNPTDITTLEVVSGKITTADWNGPVFASDGVMRLTALKDFSVAEAVKVADITGEAKFPPAIEYVDIPQAIAIHSSTHAFQECANLKTADIPHATELGGFAFDGCEQLTEANFPEAKTVGRAVFRDCVSLKTVTLAPDATFPDFTETFKNCKELTSIDCPNAETVDYQAFYGCSSLTAVSLPKLCHAIGVGAFSGCTALSRIELPAKPQSMDTSSFTGCPSPRVITFVDENGTALTGEALAAAQAAYKAVDDGDTSDDYWYGWTIGSVPTPGAGALTYPLTQDMVDEVFGPGNATLDTATEPPTITINNDVVADKTIVVKAPVEVVIDLGENTITGKPGVSPVIRVEDGANVTIKGPGSVSGVDGENQPGGTGGNGGDGIQVDGSLTVDNGADINGGAGGSGDVGGNGGDAITGSGNITINDGSATGGDGGSGSNGNGGNGGDGAGSTGGKIDIGAGGSASGGAGGDSTGGDGTGGTGGNGTQTGAGGSTTVNGETNGGNGGSGSGAGNGGNGGNGTVVDGGTAGGNGSATGGNGGGVPEDGTGVPGTGGQGVSGGDAGNVTNTPGSTGASGPVITIAVQPADQTVAANGSVDFTVEATVGDRTLIYQWYRMLGSKPNPSADTPLTNAKTFTANDKNFTGIKEMTYQFYCVLSADGAESVTTRIATLTVSNVSSGLTAPLTQEKVDNAFGPGNATLQPDGTIKIEKDVILDDPIRVETDVTIDLGGHSINGSNGQNGADGKPSFVVVGDHTLTIIGGGTISGGDGGENPGGVGGNGAPGVDLGTDGNISVDDGAINGGDGGSGSTGGNGGDGVTGGDGSNVEIGTNGNATGGNGGSGSTGAGGNGGDGTSTGGDTTVGGETAGGNGGSGSTTGGNGGNGSTSTGTGSIDVGTGGSASGGDGGSGTGNGDGGDGGNGTETGGSTTVGGNTTGGAGGMGSVTGNGGDGGDGTVIGGGTTAGGNGSATGGDGGNIPGDGTGSPGAAGDGISGGNAGNVTNTPGKAGYKVTAIVDDTKAGTSVTVPEKDLADAVVTQEDIDNNREVKVELIVEKKDDQPDKPLVEQILGETKADTIGVYFEITLEKTVTEGGTTQPSETITKSHQPIEITITIPADMRGGSNYVVIRVHDGSAEALPTTQSENKLIFQTDKFSTYAIAYTPGGTTPPTPPSGGGSHGGSGGSSSDNDQYEFWMGVKDKVNGARDGDVVKVNAHGYDKMPWSVMDALKEKSGVSLVITWNGKTITIPAGMAQKNESGRIYWPLSKLTELYAGIAENTVLNPAAETNPEKGGPGKDIPVTGGVLYVMTAPAAKPVQPSIPGQAARLQPNVPEPVTPPDAGFQADAYVGTPDAKMAEQSANGTFLAIAAAVLMILAGYGVWTRKKKKS